MKDTPDLAGVFRVLKEMVATGVISNYAVGGAVAAIFYTEPRETFDLDIFFILAGEPSNPLMRLESIYKYANLNGFETDAEFIRIYGWAVQFLESSSPLWTEAVNEAKEIEFEGVTTRVMSPEHLAAMMVETGRNKDWIRLSDFFESNVLNEKRFEEILQNHGLAEKWTKQRWRISGEA